MLYNSIVVSRMYYCVSTWYISDDHQGYKGRAEATKLALRRIQRRAVRVITGNFRTAARNAMKVEANIMPVEQMLELQLARSYLRIRAGPAYPLLKATENLPKEVRRRGYKRGTSTRSPFFKLKVRMREKYKANAVDKVETRTPFTAAPWWEPPKVIIEDSKTKVKEAYDRLVKANFVKSVIEIYTDGSGLDERVDAAA